MAAIQLNDAEFEYIKQGKGPPVILVHGSISDYRTWTNQMQPFANKYHVIAYSRRYHHPNKWIGDGSDYTVPLHSRDLSAFIELLDLGPVNLVGSSFGAFIALDVAIKAPSLVKTLVLGEPPVLPLLIANPDNPLHLLSLFIRDFSSARSFMKFGMKAFKPAQKALRAGDMYEGVRLFSNGVLGEGGFERLPEEVQASIMDNAPALKAELLGPGFTKLSVEDAASLHIPTLFVYGRNSPKFFHSISDKLADMLPDTQKAFIPDAAHDTHADNPDAYNEKVLQFLASHG